MTLLDRFGSIGGIMGASPDALHSALAERPEAAESLLAVRELTLVSLRESLVGEVVEVGNPGLTAYLISELQNPHEERLHAIFLDQTQRFMRSERQGAGARNCLAIRMRQLVQRTLDLGASMILIAHNHPSGTCRPSAEDLRVTAEFEQVARAIDIELLDHCIVARGAIYSMRQGRRL